MSSSSVRPRKERGAAAGAKLNPNITVLPTSSSMPSKTQPHKPTIIGKENPRPISRIRAATSSSSFMTSSQKCENGGDTRVRRSTSSVPRRGRSSSPSVFNRVLSNTNSNNNINNNYGNCDSNAVNRASLGCGVLVKNVERKGNFREFNVREGKKSENGIRVLKGLERSGEICKELDSNCEENENSRVRVLDEIGIKNGNCRSLDEKISEGCETGNSILEEIGKKIGDFKGLNEKCENGMMGLKESTDLGKVVVGLEKGKEICDKMKLKSEENGQFGIRVLEDGKKEVNLSSISKKACLESVHGACNIEKKPKVLDNFGDFKEFKGKKSVEKSGKGGNLGLKESGGKLLHGVRGTDILRDNGLNKYPSKLHEKLAFLEGKVKRIASDIKRTKEILDMNNPDASRVILSDIQEKISGIEKAMGHVVNCADEKTGLAKANGNDDRDVKASERTQDKQVNQMKNPVKGLNTEELEARFFPHHKLLRDRTASKTSPGGSQLGEDKIVESTSDLRVEEKSSSPINEKSIALEFLASLNKEKCKLTSRGEDVGAEFFEVHAMEGAVASAAQDSSSNTFNGISNVELVLTTDETLEEFDDEENKPAMIIEEEVEDNSIFQLNEISRKTSTGGWFVSEGESVLLAHNDGSCSFYDIANHEEKAEYKPPLGVSPNAWRDCWIIRAPGADGCSGRYVVAASAGNAMESGFCSWDFYTKDVRAFHIENGISNTRMALAPLSNNAPHRRNALSTVMVPEHHQWWYKPCGPLIISSASGQRVIRIYDIRDGEQVMKWEVQKPVLGMDYSSPLQWRNRGKVVVAEGESISLWDVSSLTAQALLTVSSSSQKISALHVNNTDAELGGGVRQRVSSSEAEGHDGVFCSPDSINVLDFRHPSGIGLKIPNHGVNVQSTFSRGDSIFLGCTNLRSAGKMQSCSQVLQFSLRKQKLFSTYSLPESNAHFSNTAITQVWGNSNLVMGVCGLGLFVFDALKDDGSQPFTNDYGKMQKIRETIGPDDLYAPSFDYLASRVLLISRDRPAQSRYLS